jgi:hypothetical protein
MGGMIYKDRLMLISTNRLQDVMVVNRWYVKKPFRTLIKPDPSGLYSSYVKKPGCFPYLLARRPRLACTPSGLHMSPVASCIPRLFARAINSSTAGEFESECLPRPPLRAALGLRPDSGRSG